MLTQAPLRRRSLGEARDLVAAWRASGKTKTAWCRSAGIVSKTLHSCVMRVKRSEAAAVRSVASGFIVVHPPRAAALIAGDLRIELGDGTRILGLDLVGVVTVLRGLREGRS
jgi:hypothetical protein